MQALGCISLMCVVVKQDDSFTLLLVLLTVAVGNRCQLSITCSYSICRLMAPLFLALPPMHRTAMQGSYPTRMEVYAEYSTRRCHFLTKVEVSLPRDSLEKHVSKPSLLIRLCIEQDLLFITMIHNLRYSRIRTGVQRPANMPL